MLIYLKKSMPIQPKTSFVLQKINAPTLGKFWSYSGAVSSIHQKPRLTSSSWLRRTASCCLRSATCPSADVEASSRFVMDCSTWLRPLGEREFLPKDSSAATALELGALVLECIEADICKKSEWRRRSSILIY